MASWGFRLLGKWTHVCFAFTTRCGGVGDGKDASNFAGRFAFGARFRTRYGQSVDVERCYEYGRNARSSFHLINSVNKKISHRIFRHMYEVLNEVYLQNFLHRWTVNRETNLMSLLNP